MKYITTNIRLPEDLYMQLKMQAAQERTSIAHLVRIKLAPQVQKQNQDIEAHLKAMKKLAKKIAARNKGQNFTQELIAMRYEQKV